MTALRMYVTSLGLPWEGMYLDTWSIAHTLFGFAAAYLLRLAGLSEWAGFGTTFGIAVAWEVGERITGVARIEAPTNSYSDIVVALIGYGFGLYLTRRYGDARPRALRLAMIAATLLFVAIYLLRQLSF